MSAPLNSHDPEATTSGGFVFGDEEPPRQALPREELLARLTALMRSCEGCEGVTVVDVAPLSKPDRAGCNWSSTLVIDPAGVAPEVYALAYASVIGTARVSWNLA